MISAMLKFKKTRTLETSEECNSYSVHSLRAHSYVITLQHYCMIRVTVVINDKVASDTAILIRFR